MADVIPFAPRRRKLGYAPGVNPFDPKNPVHIETWNTLHALGWSEQRRQEREQQEGGQ